MKRVRVRYLPEASDAVRSIYRYIAQNDGLARADRWFDRFLEGVDQLEHEATTWPVVTTRSGHDIRSKRVIIHRVYYRLEEATATAWIIDVVHTANQPALDRYADDPDA